MVKSDERAERGFPVAALVGIVSIATVMVIAFVVWFVGFRDTWEANHRFQIERLSEDAASLKAAGHVEESLQKQLQLKELVGGRQLVDATLRQLHQDALEQIGSYEQRIAALRREQDNRINEVQHLSQIVALENDATALARLGDLDGAIAALDEANAAVERFATESPAFADARQRVSTARVKVNASLKERARDWSLMAKSIERATAAANVRVGSETARVGGGAWITMQSGKSETLRGLEIHAVRRWIPVAETLDLALAQVERNLSINEYSESLLARLLDEHELKEAENAKSTPRDDLAKAERDVQSAMRKRSILDAMNRLASDTKLLDRARLRYAVAKKSPAGAMIDVCELFATIDLYRDEEAAAWIALVSRHRVSRTQTDIDGKYQLTVPVGSHVLYAEFASKSSSVIWCVPANVTNSKGINLDLHNNNASEISNGSK